MKAAPRRQNALGRIASNLLHLSIVAIALSTVATSARAQADPNSGAAKLVVGTMRVPPFVLRSDDGQWRGLSIELWKEIAAELKLNFEFRPYDYDQTGLLDAVERREIDAAIGAIPVTAEGEVRFDFSHPYFTDGLGVAVRAEPQNAVLATIGGLFTLPTLGAISGLAALLLVVGTLVWLVERHRQSHFDRHPLHGIADGVWWAAVTMTTTGYGDKVPASAIGRLLAICWMFASIFLVALFSATLASSFVVNELKTGINGPDDLPRVRIGVVARTAGEQWAREQGLVTRTYPFVIQASKALQRGEVQALVYEKSILGHMIKEYGWRSLRVLPHTLAVQDYAIAMPTDSPIKEPVNIALLKVTHRPGWKRIVQQYIGTTD